MLLGCRDHVAVVHRFRHVIDNVHIQAAGGGAAVDVLGNHIEMLADAVGARTVWVVPVIGQGVAVAHHPGARVVAGDGQGVAFRGDHRLREAGSHAARDHGDAAHGQGLQAIRRRDFEGALLGQCIRVRRGAVAQVLLVDGQLAVLHVQPIEGDRVVEVADVQRQGRRAGIAISVLDCVGEILHAIAATAQVLEVRGVRVERVGVGTVCCQDQCAVAAGVSAGDHRAACHAVGALDIIGQHVPGQFDMLLGCRDHVAIIESLWRIIMDDHIQRTLGDIAVTVTDQYLQVLGQRLGPVVLDMLPGGSERVAVTYLASARVVAGNRQAVTQAGGNRLANAGHHTTRHHVDATDTEVEHAILSYHSEAAALGQRRRITGRTHGQIRLVQAQFTRGEIQA